VLWIHSCHQFRDQFEENSGVPSDRNPNEYGASVPPDTPSVGLWSRRSRVRVPSLTLKKSLQIGCFSQMRASGRAVLGIN
jgi:hypothetical protein